MSSKEAEVKAPAAQPVDEKSSEKAVAVTPEDHRKLA